MATTTSEQLANAIAAMADASPTLVAAIERPRTIREILDVRDSFVAGYPERVEQTCRAVESFTQ